MKSFYLVASFLFLSLILPEFSYAGKGSFLIYHRVYLYSQGPLKGKRIYTRKRSAYNVLEVSEPVKSGYSYLIVYTSSKDSINGSGYIIENENEIKEVGDSDKIRVYPKIPKNKEDITTYIIVLPKQISFTGKQETTPLFPNIEWRAVNYKTFVSRKLWINHSAGFYRPAKNAEWLQKTADEVFKKKYKSSVERKILMGLVETGFTEEQVRLSLGEPVKINVREARNETEWEYDGQRIVFKENKVQHVL